MIVLNLIDASELSERSESRHAIDTKLNFFFFLSFLAKNGRYLDTVYVDTRVKN